MLGVGLYAVFAAATMAYSIFKLKLARATALSIIVTAEILLIVTGSLLTIYQLVDGDQRGGSWLGLAWP